MQVRRFLADKGLWKDMLFDSESLARNLEQAYASMIEERST